MTEHKIGATLLAIVQGFPSRQLGSMEGVVRLLSHSGVCCTVSCQGRSWMSSLRFDALLNKAPRRCLTCA